MIRFTTGNLLEADVEALVNTVNTVGVMGKGIALMFKERFPENYRAYAIACKAGEVDVGRMFVQPSRELGGPKWIINFPTKKHWRHPTKEAWVKRGLEALKVAIRDYSITSIAIPPLGCGNGGLKWSVVRPWIEEALTDLAGVDILVYEPVATYQNVAKRSGVDRLTPARALVAELIRRYWVLDIECTILEVQKLSWFLERHLDKLAIDNPLDLRFSADRYGPYANRLTHLLNGLDGSYLQCAKRLADASPFDTIRFKEERKEEVSLYLHSGEARKHLPALEATDAFIDGFQSPLCMEALATVDWLMCREGREDTLEAIREGIAFWPGGKDAAQRKQRLFDDRLLKLALERLQATLYA